MAKATKFWPLKKGVPADEELVRLAHEVREDWKRFGFALGLKEKELNAIKIDNPADECEHAVAMLHKWKKVQGRKATFCKLAEALNDELVQLGELVNTLSSDEHSVSIVLTLKKGIPTELQLATLTQEIPADWKRLGRALGLSESQLKAIEINNKDDVNERAFAMIRKWQEKHGRKATFEKLAEALDSDLVKRRDLVESFCCDIPSGDSDEPSLNISECSGQVIPANEGPTKEQDPEAKEKSAVESKEEASTFKDTLGFWKIRESVSSLEGQRVRDRKNNTASWSGVGVPGAYKKQGLSAQLEEERRRNSELKESVEKKDEEIEELRVKHETQMKETKMLSEKNQTLLVSLKNLRNKEEKEEEFVWLEQDETPVPIFERRRWLWNWILGKLVLDNDKRKRKTKKRESQKINKALQKSRII